VILKRYRPCSNLAAILAAVMLLFVLATLVFAGPRDPAPVPDAPAAVVITAGAEFRPGDLIILDASQSVGDTFDWKMTTVGVADDGRPLPPKPFLPVEGGRKAVFATGDTGFYYFYFAAAKGSKVATTIVLIQVGKPAPTPPPVPPAPPTPPKPDVDQALAADLAKLIQADDDADKKAHVAAYANLYLVAAEKDAADKSLKTADELRVRLVLARKQLFGDYVLLPLRSRIEVVLDAELGKARSQPLTEEFRAKAAASFRKVAAALEAANK
jgi:hypothetical protein